MKEFKFFNTKIIYNQLRIIEFHFKTMSNTDYTLCNELYLCYTSLLNRLLKDGAISVYAYNYFYNRYRIIWRNEK